MEGKKHHFGVTSGTSTPQASRKTSAEFRMAAPEGESISMCKPSDKVKNYFGNYFDHITAKNLIQGYENHFKTSFKLDIFMTYENVDSLCTEKISCKTMLFDPNKMLLNIFLVDVSKLHDT